MKAIIYIFLLTFIAKVDAQIYSFSGSISNKSENKILVNQTGIGVLFSQGDVISQDESSYIKANATDNTKTALGIVVEIIDNDNLFYKNRGICNYTKSNLTKGQSYYLDIIDGEVTSSHPTNYIQSLFVATDVNEILLDVSSMYVFNEVIEPEPDFEYLFETSIGTGEIGFSCQKLLSTTTEFGLVRRSTDGATDVLLFNGDEVNMLSTLQTSGETLQVWSSGGDVTIQEWYNQGTGGNLIQTTTSLQPHLVISGILQTSDGKTSVRFDQDNMINSNTITLTQPNAWSILIDFDDRGVNLNQIPFDSGPSGTARQIPVWLDDVSGFFTYFSGANLAVRVSDFNMNHWFCDFQNPTFQSIFYNDTNQAVSQSGPNDLSGLTLGSRFSGSSMFTGYIQEVTAWNGSKTTNKDDVRSNILSRY